MMDHEAQARSFLTYRDRTGGLWEDAWSAWSASKDFQPIDEYTIRRIVRAELLARADLTYTDLASA
jgi:hypothetical protein